MASSGEFSGERYSLDYPCVARFRHRRLITYLWLNRFRDTCSALVRETGRVFMSVAHLQGLVEKGRWSDAVSYIARFVPDPLALGAEGRTLVLFLFLHMDIAGIVAGTDQETATHVAKRPEHLILNVDNKGLDHPTMKLRSIFLQLYSSHQLRASLDWVKVRRKAAKIVKDLIYTCRELRDLTLLPACSIFRPRRHVKKLGRARMPSSHLARMYLRKKNGVSSSSHRQESRDTGSAIDNEKWLLSLIEESLQAGNHPQLREAHPLEVLFKEGAPSAPVSQKLGTSTGKSSEISLLTNAGVSGAPVLQKIATLAAKKYGISLLTNAGASGAPILRKIATLAAKKYGIASLKNAGMKENLSQEGCGVERQYKGFHSRKHPRTSLTIDEKYFDPKRPRLTGTFGDTSLASVTGAHLSA